MKLLQVQHVKVIIGIVYLGSIFYLLFLASFRTSSNDVNLIPFRYIVKQINYVNTHEVHLSYYLYVHVVILANLFLLTPIPMLFPLVIVGLRRVVLIILVPVIIELIQFIFEIGTTDIDDFILNAMGFSIGFYLSDEWRRTK